MKTLEERKAARREATKRYRLRHPERYKQSNKRSFKKRFLRDPDKFRSNYRAYSKRWYRLKGNQERVKCYRKKRFDRDPKKFRAAQQANARRWSLQNPKKRREIVKRSRKKSFLRNPGKIRKQRQAASKRWRLRHIVHVRAKWRNEAHSRHCRITPSKAEKAACYQYIMREVRRKFHRCYYCKKRFSGRFEVDHIIPFSKNGRHIVSNLCIACLHCNKTKMTKLPGQFQPATNQPILAL